MMILGKSNFLIKCEEDEHRLTKKPYYIKSSILKTMILEIGVTGIIAIIIILTACSISLVQIISGMQVELPKFLYESFMLVVGFYLGQKIQRIEKGKKNNEKFGFTRD